jgi:hypothetical protein
LLRTFLQSVYDIPTVDVVSLLDNFTQPRANNNRPLAKLFFNELAEKKVESAPTLSEQEAIDVMCKRFLYVSTPRPTYRASL